MIFVQTQSQPACLCGEPFRWHANPTSFPSKDRDLRQAGKCLAVACSCSKYRPKADTTLEAAA